ncbi:hypothetical protein [Flagellimonas sediminis]|uniref:Uncharacterized protein n=1 Tax=Flagellimonas sediminis TaxID=2696468 RepID=A0A6I5L025_9FLAO|nr:hypothetical protein [Allomuricauda sediminis]NDV43121.1 hypothetical protein [Allomuricauda sediminis]
MTEVKMPAVKISAQYLTIVYVVLVCLGYAEKSIFYEKFDIDIANYLSFEEYLLFFLPIGSFSIILIVGFIGYFTLMFSVADLLKVPFLPRKIVKETNPSKKEKNGITWSKMANLAKFGHVLKNLFFVIIVLTPIVVLLINHYELGISSRTTENLLVLWSIVLMVTAIGFSWYKESQQARILGFGGLIIFFILIYRSNTINKAKNIIDGKPDLSATVHYKDKVLRSSDSIIYIGQTKEYLFFREIRTSGNVVISKKNITTLTIRPSNKERN